MYNGFRIVFALYHDFTQLSFAGPCEVFSRLPGATCVLASVDGGTVRGDGGITFANVAELRAIADCSLLCIPGGFGTIKAMEDAVYLSELRRLAASARYVTSVCTGSLLLAAAGLLDGKRAACHWAFRDLLARFDVAADSSRVVRDGNVITGGGITAGIDMALTVMAEIAGFSYAQSVELALEYAPGPALDFGCPERAFPEIIAAVNVGVDAVRQHLEVTTLRAAAVARFRKAAFGTQGQCSDESSP